MSSEISPSPGPISLKEFFESTPPGARVMISGIPYPQKRPPAIIGAPQRRREPSLLPNIQLHCDEDPCGGVRNFATQTELELAESEAKLLFINYICKNCHRSIKTYAISIERFLMEDEAVRAFKFGEDPAFGPPLPSKLIALVRPEWDYFQKGR